MSFRSNCIIRKYNDSIDSSQDTLSLAGDFRSTFRWQTAKLWTLNKCLREIM